MVAPRIPRAAVVAAGAGTDHRKEAVAEACHKGRRSAAAGKGRHSRVAAGGDRGLRLDKVERSPDRPCSIK